MIQPGDTLHGYRVESILGEGGLGVVYRAHQLSMGRSVAVKVLSGAHLLDESFQERFRREGRIAAQLDHPNILPVYEAGEANGHLFIAMRLVDGPTMGDLFRERGALRWQRVLEILAPIASALDAAGSAGLVHPDVKPENILISSGGHPYLADFGLMRLARTSEATRAGEWLGSPDYAAPEHMIDAECSLAVDVYSLTAVAFHALTGHVAYERSSDLAVLHAQATAPPPRIALFNPAIPPRLDEVIAWGMAKDPRQRAPSASMLIEELATVLRSAPIEAVLVETPERQRPAPSDRASFGGRRGPKTDSLDRATTAPNPPPSLYEPRQPTTTAAESLGPDSRADTIVDPQRPPGVALDGAPPDPPRRARVVRPLVPAIALALVAAVGLIITWAGEDSARVQQVQRPSFAIELRGAGACSLARHPRRVDCPAVASGASGVILPRSCDADVRGRSARRRARRSRSAANELRVAVARDAKGQPGAARLDRGVAL